ncbi:MAG TPA: hypothetical protein DD473_21980 [Planctomycetaceae bacterium]|nr:hypothetical protein [Planctomycetaceae bacterium]
MPNEMPNSPEQFSPTSREEFENALRVFIERSLEGMHGRCKFYLTFGEVDENSNYKYSIHITLDPIKLALQMEEVCLLNFCDFAEQFSILPTSIFIFEVMDCPVIMLVYQIMSVLDVSDLRSLRTPTSIYEIDVNQIKLERAE